MSVRRCLARSRGSGSDYGTEVRALLLKYVLWADDTPTVKTNAYESDDASRGLLERLGFEQEGHHRRVAFLDGAYRDRITYGILREAWENPLN